jgi:hypothetical protein
MENEKISQYQQLCNNLKEMREEYKMLPTTFLKNKIELLDKKLITIDGMIPNSTKGGGNYKPKT